MKFSELDLKPEILKSLDEMSYVDLTPVQEGTLEHILAGKDLLAMAETGSGKTGACGVPLAQMIDPAVNAIQALILVPTRELALQYVSEITSISQYTGIAPFAMFGGFSMEIQRAKLDHAVHILVATPGRLIDFLYNTPLTLSHVRTLVLDEADRMLDMGFVDDVDFILSCMIQEHQTLLFSATMSREIDRLARRFLKNPIRVELNRDKVAPESLSHQFQYTGHRNKSQILEAYIEQEKVAQAILFCNSRNGGEKLYDHLRDKLTSVDFLHGGLEQARRTVIYNRFKKKEIVLLVATDIASRGLDFTHVSHVINYDFPRDHETYTHRTGRTARMGREGIAMSLVADRDLSTLQSVINVNQIKPIWHGSEPDLRKIGRRKNRGEKRHNYSQHRSKNIKHRKTASTH